MDATKGWPTTSPSLRSRDSLLGWAKRPCGAIFGATTLKSTAPKLDNDFKTTL
jgi:hypothetical protein